MDCTSFAQLVREKRASSEIYLDTIHFDDFKELMVEKGGWGCHFGARTPLMKLLDDDFYPYPDELADCLSVDRLLILGVLMCKGSLE
jgi:hypothetical protein